MLGLIATSNSNRVPNMLERGLITVGGSPDRPQFSRTPSTIEHVGREFGIEQLVQQIISCMCSLTTCSTDLLGCTLGSIATSNSNRAPNMLDSGLITLFLVQ
ncbi:hypothetical protein JTB14_007511 [Gonioctena quinquepunctata]|nr:hypothetical protein JTB14_007511 [Gonioctena quinquepunctata]